MRNINCETLPESFRMKKLVTAVMLASALAVPVVQAQEDNKKETPEDVENIVVTGVFSAKSLEDAPVAISVVGAEELEQQIPTSASDILKNVPGVFVNSALGEIRNIVFSRGVSANSLDGANGNYYVSMQENSVPVELMTAVNYGPDYFMRPDIMLDHVESVRGGTASVTGANAPGGVFNYIMRTGKTFQGTQIRAQYGLEAEENPSKRIDFYTGGEMSDGTYYAVGGFYRQAEGARYPGYNLNDGGQVRANILHEYTSGRIQINAKYLDDHNGWFEFIPSVNYANPTPVEGFDETSSVLPPANPHGYTNVDGTTGRWDGSNVIHSKESSINIDWSQDLGNDFGLHTWLGYAKKSTNWNTGAVITAMSLTDIFSGILPGTFGMPGETIYRFQDSGEVAARVQSFSGFDRTVTESNLPNAQLFNGAGIFSQFAMVNSYDTDEVFFKSVLNKDFDNHSVIIGVELSKADIENKGGAAGTGLATLEPQPQMLDIVHIMPDGTELSVTDPAGFAAHANGVFSGAEYTGNQKQFSLFAGDTWYVNDELTLDAAVRYEKIDYEATNVNPGPAFALNEGGGIDGDPTTLWDNMRNSTYDTAVARDYSYLAYTASATYEWSPEVQTYIRYSDSKKAPDMGAIIGLNEPAEIELLFPEEQSIKQLEIGIKYNDDDWNVALFPFYSHLSNVGAIQQFLDSDNIAYTTPTRFGEITTYGIEADVDWAISSTLSVRSALTLQNAEASGFGIWQENTPSRDDDTFTLSPDGDADNVPKVMFRGTATWNPVEDVAGYLTANYMGKRPANREGAWDLPDYWTFDVGVSWTVNDNWVVRGQVNNLTNEYGVMSWARSGSFLESLDRQALTKQDIADNPDAIIGIVPVQPRSYWVTATYTF